MVVRLIGGSEYQAPLALALAESGLAVKQHGVKDWRAGRVRADANRAVIVAGQSIAGAIGPKYALIAVQYGCAMESGLRCRDEKQIALGERQLAAARRKGTFWVACSAWAAHYCRLHTGLRVNKIIFPAVEVERFMPSERQRLRTTETPVILHSSPEGDAALEGVSQELGPDFVVRRLSATPEQLPDALRDGDIWLSLEAGGDTSGGVIRAMAANLVIVGTNVGALWPYTTGTPLYRHGMLAWRSRQVGGVVFDWKQRDYPKAVASHIRAAWQYRAELQARRWARRWHNLDLFGQKWLEAIAAAARQFGLKDSGVVATAEVKAAAAVHPWEGKR